MKLVETEIEGCFVVEYSKYFDDRGFFARMFDFSALENSEWSEPFFPHVNASLTLSAGSVRGLHFQEEPFEERKIVFLGRGTVDDLLLDTRPASSTFGKAIKVRLSAGENAVFVPSGIAHGFQTLVDDVLLIYLVSQVHSPEHERGFSIDSILDQIELDLSITSMSTRDKTLPPFKKKKPGEDFENTVCTS